VKKKDQNDANTVYVIQFKRLATTRLGCAQYTEYTEFDIGVDLPLMSQVSVATDTINFNNNQQRKEETGWG
jgi:hypothetical protein